MVPVLAVLLAQSELGSPEGGRTLPDHLENIVVGFHPSLGEVGRRSLRNILHQYAHVFPAPGEDVTGWTMSVQHEILTSHVQPVWCGPRRLAPAGLRTRQTCIREKSD